MKLGTEDKKKVKWLIGLAVVAAIAFYTQVLSDSPSAPAPKPAVSERNTATELDPTPSTRAALPPSTPRTAPGRSRSDEFRPTFRSKRPEDRIDPLTIDPTLRTDLLAKVQNMKMEGGTRNLFQFGAAPAAELKGPEPKVVVAKVFDYPRPLPPPPPKAADPPPPPEPPIDVKYYGLATKKVNGKTTAFFLDSENNIILAPVGDLIKKKYRVVRIGLTSVVMENVDNKKQQTVPLAEDAGANMGN